MSWRTIPTILGKGAEISWIWAITHSLVFQQSFHLLIQDQGLVLSAVSVPLDFSQFRLCPWAMPFFQKLCSAPSLLLQYSKNTSQILQSFWTFIPQLGFFFLKGLYQNQRLKTNSSHVIYQRKEQSPMSMESRDKWWLNLIVFDHVIDFHAVLVS